MSFAIYCFIYIYETLFKRKNVMMFAMCFYVLAHLQKLMSDKKCSAEKKGEMDSVITQVHHLIS